MGGNFVILHSAGKSNVQKETGIYFFNIFKAFSGFRYGKPRRDFGLLESWIAC